MNNEIKIQNTKDKNQNLRHFFSVKSILTLLILVVLVRMIAWNINHKETKASDLSLENIMQAVNNERTLRNLSALNTDSRLSSAAQSKSEDMQSRHYFSHTDPEGNYIWPKIVAAGYTPYLQLGENLAIEFYNTESLVSAWMNSPTHRANVLNEGFKDQGMGLQFGDSTNGEYHSAITNTFGTLVGKKVVTPKPVAPTEPATTPKPAPTPKPQTLPATTPTPVIPKTTSPTPTPETPKPSYQTLPSSSVPSFPLITIEQKPNFATPERPTASNTAPSETSTITPVNTKPSEISKPEEPFPENRNIKRYLSLALTILLILFVVSDIKEAVENKLKGLDKKANNLVLLILALVVIAFLYWL